jgi:predicted membrane protein
MITGSPPAEPGRGCRGGRGGGSRGRLWVGLLLIGLGVLFALAIYGVVDLEPFWRLSPLILIFFGLRMTLRSRGRHAAGFVLLFLGAWFLLKSFGVLNNRLILASILVIVGLSFVLSALAPRRPFVDRPGGAPAGASAVVHRTAVLGTVTQASTAQDFRGGSAAAFLGSCEIDLRQAAMAAGDDAVLEAHAFWGGIRIFVPASWSVAIEGASILGGFHDFTRPPAVSSQRLVVTGLALMGAVEVRNDREAGR